MPRLPKTRKQKQLEGDTGKKGSRKHAAEIAGTKEPPDGPVPLPNGVLGHVGRRHFGEIRDQLEAMGELTPADSGVMVTAACAYELMAACRRKGDARGFGVAAMRYLQASDRLSLNQSARARLGALKPGGGGSGAPVNTGRGPRLVDQLTA